MDDEKSEANFVPRSYQLQLLDYVCNRNGIIYLPTGAGKTFIAILALKRFSVQMHGQEGKQAIYMCNTVELARQQYKQIKKLTNLKVNIFIGDRGVDNWNHAKWRSSIDNYQVLVGTAQIFVDMVNQTYIKITNLSIVIIDECHHATGSHPMHAFLNAFQYCDPNHLPRVVGLTGVLIKGNKTGKVLDDLSNLEATLRGNIITINDMDEQRNVMLYSTKPKEELVVYSSHKHNFCVYSVIKDLIGECKRIVDSWEVGTLPQKLSKNFETLREPSAKNVAKNMLSDFVYQMEDFGLYAAAIAIMSPLIEFEIKKRQAESIALRNMYRLMIQYCDRIRHIIVKELKSFLGDYDENNESNDSNESNIKSLEVMQNYSTPKLLSLFVHMKQKFQGKKFEDISCLIFVTRRYSAKCLYFVLKDYISQVPELQNIRPQYAVGRNSTFCSTESILEAKWTKTCIDQFRSKEVNLLVCSNVLEEGIDFQGCNYVFSFDPLKTFNSYLQSKGRARTNNSYYSVFSSDVDKMGTLEKIRNYCIVHEQIKTFLTGRVLEREDPNEEEIAKQFIELIPPYEIASGARLTAPSALQLLHRYCQTLPKDSFGSQQPWFAKLPKKNGEIAVSIKLPLQSSVKETLLSDYFKTTREAKISAAFKACVKLYQNGELNDNFLPVTKTECIAKVSNIFFKHWEKYSDDINKKEIVGRQLKRIYNKPCPEEFKNALPSLGETSYAYTIQFSTDFSINEYTEHIVKYLGSKTSYAILLNKKMPKLAQMPLFMSQGKLHVKISEEPIQCVIKSEKDLDQLKRFHIMLFRNILKLWKEFFVLDHRNDENSILIVPLDENLTIDWKLIKDFQNLSPCRSYSPLERQTAIYRPQDYLNKVVTKWYNELPHENFVVTKVREDLTPMSPFDTKPFDTYVDFYASRYNLNIANKKQFLLEVQPLTQRRNFVNNASNKSAEQRKKRNKVILVPELCHNYKYPADLWLKALFLPTILHRVYYMLHAETLRKCINKFLDLEKYFGDYSPKPLIIDTSLKRVLDDEGNLVKGKEHPKKVLLSLPTKKVTKNYQMHKSINDNTNWKTYMEPIDLSRTVDKLYTVELDYYYKFIAGLIYDVENLKLSNEQEYSTLQFDISDGGSSNLKKTEADRIRKFDRLSIKDSTIEEKIEIKILKRTFEPDNCLKSAEQYEFLAAITTAYVNDVFDMERYELLGDAFLKFSVSLYLTNKYTTWHEGFLTIVKSRMVSNRNLLYCMMESKICQRICSTLFNPNIAWLPPLVSLPANVLELLKQNLSDSFILNPCDFYNLQLTEEEIFSGKCSDDKLGTFVDACNKSKEITAAKMDVKSDNDMNIFLYKDTMRDKVVADCLEALLGVCVKNYGICRSFKMLNFFGILPTPEENSEVNLLNLKLNDGQLRANTSKSEIDGFLSNCEYLEKNLGYSFRDRAFLLQALTHPSYPTNRLTGCYQELEFIGDAILDMLITCYIFERFPEMTPGKMTDLRMALVNNITLGCICIRFKFHLFLLYENAALSEAINTFADFQQTQNHRVTEQVRILMEDNCDDELNPFNDILDYASDDDSNDENDDGNLNANGGISIKEKFNLAQNVDVPKALGDVVEALIAAVYLDCRDLNTTWKVIYNLLKTEIEDFSYNAPIDPVRQLGEIKQANPRYSKPFVNNTDIMVTCVFNCLDKSYETNGFGSNAKQAKKAAAKQALQIFTKHFD